MERNGQAATVTFFSTDEFVAGVSVTLGDDAAQHARVLRLGSGERVELRDGRGNAARGILARVAKRSLSVDVLEVWTIPDMPPVHMLVPVADRDRMLYLAEKCTELAATSWRPVIWRRSRSVGPAGDGPAFQSRLKGRMVAALNQAAAGFRRFIPRRLLRVRSQRPRKVHEYFSMQAQKRRSFRTCSQPRLRSRLGLRAVSIRRKGTR